MSSVKARLDEIDARVAEHEHRLHEHDLELEEHKNRIAAIEQQQATNMTTVQSDQAGLMAMMNSRLQMILLDIQEELRSDRAKTAEIVSEMSSKIIKAKETIDQLIDLGGDTIQVLESRTNLDAITTQMQSLRVACEMNCVSE